MQSIFWSILQIFLEKNSLKFDNFFVWYSLIKKNFYFLVNRTGKIFGKWENKSSKKSSKKIEQKTALKML